VVIDDGSHVADHARQSFEYHLPLLSPGGLYVIEDLHTSYLPAYGGGIPAPNNTAVAFLRELIDEVQTRDRVFERRVQWTPPPTSIDEVAAIHIYPGIAFIEKANPASSRTLLRPPGS
jgi:hypothetical protein